MGNKYGFGSVAHAAVSQFLFCPKSITLTQTEMPRHPKPRMRSLFGFDLMEPSDPNTPFEAVSHALYIETGAASLQKTGLVI
jgi:hypothetical protein